MPPHPTSWRFIFILSSHLPLHLQSGPFLSDLPTKTQYVTFLSPTRDTYSAGLFFLVWSGFGCAVRNDRKSRGFGLVGYDAVSLGERFVTFERTYCLRSQASDALDLMNDGCMLLRNICNLSPSDTPSHRRRPENTCFVGPRIVLSYTRLPIACSAHLRTQSILYHFTMSLRHARLLVVG